jgi:hypothetical protein
MECLIYIYIATALIYLALSELDELVDPVFSLKSLTGRVWKQPRSLESRVNVGPLPGHRVYPTQAYR